MRFKLLFAASLEASLSFAAFGYIAELDFHDWYEESQPLPDGWTHDGLKKGSETAAWKGGAYFDYGDMGWLKSPVFDSPIRSVTLYVATSKPDPSRNMFIYPISKGITNKTGEPVVPTAKRSYEEREFAFDNADQFVLKFDVVGTNGNWGLIRIIVRYGDESTDDERPGLRSWSIADVAQRPGFRVADFSMLQYVVSGATMPWKNGITIDGFHAFAGTESCTEIHFTSGFTPRYSWLYALKATEEDVPDRALAMRGTSGNAMSLMLPIALDSDRVVASLSVAYRIWAPAESNALILSFTYRALDDLTQMGTVESGWSVPPSIGKSGDTRSVDVPMESLRGSKYVCFRWRLPQEPNLPAIGISDVRVSAELEPSGFAVIIR